MKKILSALLLVLCISTLVGCVKTHSEYQDVRATVINKYTDEVDDGIGSKPSMRRPRTTYNITVKYNEIEYTEENTSLYNALEIDDKVNCTLKTVYDINNNIVNQYLSIK